MDKKQNLSDAKLEVVKTLLAQDRDLRFYEIIQETIEGYDKVSGILFRLNFSNLFDYDLSYTRPETLIWKGKRYLVSYWVDIYRIVIKDLIVRNKLRKEHLPIRPNSGYRYCINTEPKYKDGSDFSYNKEQIGSFWIELNYSAENLMKNTKFIIETVGESPTDFEVEFWLLKR